MFWRCASVCLYVLGRSEINEFMQNTVGGGKTSGQGGSGQEVPDKEVTDKGSGRCVFTIHADL